MFASLQKKFPYYRTCSLCFDIEENPIIEAFVRFRFDIVAITIMGYSGAWVKLIHEKKTEVKNLVTLSL
jgi:hypothetical protein